MNKRRVEQLIPKAINLLNDNKEINNKEKGGIDKKFRSKISSFGAAVTMGSFKSAVAFFSEQNNSDVQRDELIKMMYNLYTGEQVESAKTVLIAVANADEATLADMKAFFIDASIAIKLALNAFNLI